MERLRTDLLSASLHSFLLRYLDLERTFANNDEAFPLGRGFLLFPRRDAIREAADRACLEPLKRWRKSL